MSEDYLESRLEIIETCIREIRHHQGIKPKASPQLKFDAEKIPWKPMIRDNKSKWELVNLKDNPDNGDLKELIGFLDNAGGRVASEGFFYWLFPDKMTVGRQLNKKRGVEK
jgi:hypothetical protein